jgi:hypothetical protein
VFSWDAQKALHNVEKHGLSFEEAGTVFADPEALDWVDLEHSGKERRFKRLGASVTGRVLLVVYTVRRRARNAKETVRIISARQASRKERRAYFGRAN